MCGRYSFIADEEQLKQQFQPIEIASTIPRSYNIAPTQLAPVITNAAPALLQPMNWGLVPHWSKDGKNSGRLINARAEGIFGKPSFRLSIRQKRCLVLADSFYEWKRIGKEKQPYRILAKDGALLVFAGIWDTWSKSGTTLQTFSIITTPPNQEMQSVHSRMPLLLPHSEQQEQWLEDNNIETIADLLVTPADGLLDYYPVSKKVNKVGNNSPDLHDRFNDQPELF